MKLCRQKPRLGIPGFAIMEMQQIMLGQLGRHYLLNFLEMRRQTCRQKFRNGAQKKVPKPPGLVGVLGPLVEGSGPSLAQT